jgi:hypothetical protein
MEWDHVQVCGDYIDLANYKKDKNNNNAAPAAEFVHLNKKQKFPPESPNNNNSNPKWKFGFASWGDDLNLLYVAVTRAKKTLSLPSCYLKCVYDFDAVYKWKTDGCSEETLPELEGFKEPQSSDDLRGMYTSLVALYRESINTPYESLLSDHLLLQEDEDRRRTAAAHQVSPGSATGSDMDDDDEFLEGRIPSVILFGVK